MWHKILEILRNIFRKEDTKPEEQPEENPFIPQLRPILEQILRQYGKTYREFRPLLIDGDPERESWEIHSLHEKTETVLEQLTPDLNYFTIATERQEYFYGWREKLYREEGLLITLCGKEELPGLEGYNTVLDMERAGAMYPCGLRGDIIYLPLYKRPWKILENIDIEVPIGYNIKIVERNWLTEDELCMNVNEEQ